MCIYIYIYTSLWLSQKHDWNFERYDVLGLLARLGWPVGGKLVAHTKTHDKPRCVESLAFCRVHCNHQDLAGLLLANSVRIMGKQSWTKF